MIGLLDLVWDPRESPYTSAPPVGQAPAIVRDDDYEHRFEFWKDDSNEEPWILDGAAAHAHLRRSRVSTPTATDPDAEFDVTIDGNAITLRLASAVTRVLIPTGWWDLQIVQDGKATTLLGGRFAVVNDVTRVP